MPTGKFKPPPMGPGAAQGAKTIMAKVYTACRLRWVSEHPKDPENKKNKATCASVAWKAVESKGYTKQPSGKWGK